MKIGLGLLRPASLSGKAAELDRHLSEAIAQFSTDKEILPMAPRLIEIRGLGADVASVKKGIGDLRAAAADLNAESEGLKAEMVDLKEQIEEHRKDLRFEAETLGNSSGNSDQAGDKKS